MTIVDLLNQNASLYANETALTEINPCFEPESRITWREYSLVQPEPGKPFHRAITWGEFQARANRFANLLMSRGCRPGDKVAILLMNSIEWLPVYFGVLKAGAVVVPLNYRYVAEEIRYCLEKADCSVLVFGPEFVGRMEEICDRLPGVRHMFYVGEDCPTFADSYEKMISYCTDADPALPLREEGGAESPRADARGRLPLHSAPVSHRRQNALVRLADERGTRRAAQGDPARMDSAGGVGGALHHRLAAGALGAGHSGRHRAW